MRAFQSEDAYGRVAENDWSTGTPLTADTDATSQCTLPVGALENFEKAR